MYDGIKFMRALDTKFHFRVYWLGISFEGHRQLVSNITLNLATVCEID